MIKIIPGTMFLQTNGAGPWLRGSSTSLAAACVERPVGSVSVNEKNALQVSSVEWLWNRGWNTTSFFFGLWLCINPTGPRCVTSLVTVAEKTFKLCVPSVALHLLHFASQIMINHSETYYPTNISWDGTGGIFNGLNVIVGWWWIGDLTTK